MSAAGSRPDWVDARLFPFTSHYADVAGCRIHYLDEGQGPALLLLHGNPTWSFLYRHLVTALRDRFRCIAPDYPGFGLSTARSGYGFTPAEHADVVGALVDALQLDDFVPFVQDWGGPIGLAVAARRAERVPGVVIGNTFAWPVAGVWHFEWFSRLFGGPLGRVAARRANVVVNLLIPAGTRRRQLTRAEMAHYRRPLATPAARQPTSVFAREVRARSPFLAEVEAGLARLGDKPALIVWGDRDIAFRRVERRRFEQLFPRHTVVELVGAGHFIQEDAPDEIAAALRAWWGQHGPPT
jgi:haloalkane dehalogenase